MFNPLDKVLHRTNKSLEDLNSDELAFYRQAQDEIGEAPPTINEQVEILENLIENITIELIATRTDDSKDCYLKSRLQNALFMKNALTKSEKAKKYYEKVAKKGTNIWKDI